MGRLDHNSGRLHGKDGCELKLRRVGSAIRWTLKEVCTSWMDDNDPNNPLLSAPPTATTREETGVGCVLVLRR